MSVRYKFDLFTLKGSDNEDSDQEREWEEQQIKKGVSLGSEVSSVGSIWGQVRHTFNVITTPI